MCLYWKKDHRLTLHTTDKRGDKNTWNRIDHTETAFKLGYTFRYVFTCNGKGQATVQTRPITSDKFVTRGTGRCDLGWTNGRTLDMWMSSPWIAPADVQITQIAYEFW